MSFNEAPALDAWIERLRERLEALPTTIDELLNAYRARSDRLRPVCSFHDQDDANVDYLEYWARTGDVPLPPPRWREDGSLQLDSDHQERLHALRTSIVVP